VGRKKSYEASTLVEAALPLFHASGYGGTSTEALVQALGVNRNSMYSEFGSKLGLFEAALTRYEAQVLEQVFGPLEEPDAGTESIAALLEQFGEDAAGPASGLGCLLCNTAVELAGADPGGGRFIARYFERVEGAFRRALATARRRGRLAPRVVAADEARWLTATTLGLFVLVRGRAAPEVVQGAARAARRHLESLSAPGDAPRGRGPPPAPPPAPRRRRAPAPRAAPRPAGRTSAG
jgi:TetR/AcrR family transcriptional repressor of nem operon